MYQIFIDLCTMGPVPVPMGEYEVNMQTGIVSKNGRCCEEKQNRVRESGRCGRQRDGI